jgi:DNA polymerase V
MPHGGKRPGAGRPRKEPTLRLRIPADKLDDVTDFLLNDSYNIPLYSSKVPAGLPSEGDGYVTEYVNLCQRLIPHKEHIFSVFASGDSMIGAGIFDGDLLIVSRQEEARHRKIVIATIDGQQTVKRLHIDKGHYTLLPENDNFQPIPIVEGMDFSIQGVVMSCIKMF